MKRDDFTEKWVEHFNTVNKDCILSLPFNPNHIGKLDQLSVLSYVQAANKHARLWRWPLLAIAKRCFISWSWFCLGFVDVISGLLFVLAIFITPVYFLEYNGWKIIGEVRMIQLHADAIYLLIGSLVWLIRSPYSFSIQEAETNYPTSYSVGFGITFFIVLFWWPKRPTMYETIEIFWKLEKFFLFYFHFFLDK